MEEQPARSKTNLLWQGLALVVFLGSIPLLAPWCNSWHWSRHPPVEEHRRELIELTSKQFNCPPEELVITPSGDVGAEVRGCGGWTKLCWRQPARLWPHAWRDCYSP